MSTFKYYKNGQWNTVNSTVTGDTLPIGTITEYGGTTAPTNWLICDGSAVSRTTYADLFNTIGINFGSGDGSTTFNLPDLRGRVPVGKSTDVEFDTLGEKGGEKTHMLTYSEMPSELLVGSSKPEYKNWATSAWSDYSSYAYSTNTISRSTYADTANNAHNNLQPYQVVNYIIKASQSIGVVGNVLNTHSNSQIDTYSCDYVNKNTSYSTSEISTGKTWIDGKPIYRKVVNIGTPLNKTIYYDHGISNMENIIELHGCCVLEDGTREIIPNNYTDWEIFCYDVTNTAFTLKFSTNMWGQNPTNVLIILEYTKSTD